jgi:tol-pal system protein YbgF
VSQRGSYLAQNPTKDHFKCSGKRSFISPEFRQWSLRDLLGRQIALFGRDNSMSSGRCANSGFYKLLFLLFLIIFKSSCVSTQQDLLYLNDQVAALNSRLNKLEESQSQQLSIEIEAQLRSIRNTQAELVAENQKIRGEIRYLSGRIEENTHKIEQNIERGIVEGGTGKGSLSQLETEVDYILAYLDLEIPQRLEDRYMKKEGLGDKAVRDETTSDKEGAIDSEIQLYKSILKACKLAQYERALFGFRDFLKKYPNSDFADDAWFWTGVCHMALEHYEQAIITYQELINKYPNGDKVPGAMLRQAISFQEIGDHTASRIVLKKIVKQYQNSSEAKIATEKLKTQLTKSGFLSASSQNSTSGVNAYYHIVRRGDSLYGVAQKYDVTVKNLRRLNNLTNGQFIYPGQKLLVKPEATN